MAGLIAAAAGALVIVGGGLKADNSEVYRAFVERVAQGGRVAVIPAASSEPQASADAIAANLARYGVPRERIDVVALAVVDDPATPVDESRWAENAFAPAEVAKVASAAGIWLTGGDQLRLGATLIRPDGSDTLMLAALRERLKAGAVIGGTSAGAAAMSATMILRGDPLASLTRPRDDAAASASALPARDERLAMGRGLGLFRFGLLDQHFAERGRLGRLARALSAEPARIGFGIDENTALVVDVVSAKAEVLGRGAVAVLDARGARFGEARGRFAAEGITLSLATAGDRIDLATLAVTPSAAKRAVTPEASEEVPPPARGAPLEPPVPLPRALSDGLFLHADVAEMERLAFDGEGRGVRFRFRETPRSSAFAKGDAITITGVEFSLAPVNIAVRALAR